MSSANTMRVVMRQEAQRQRQKARAAAARLRAQLGNPMCEANLGEPMSVARLIEAIFTLPGESTETDRRH